MLTVLLLFMRLMRWFAIRRVRHGFRSRAQSRPGRRNAAKPPWVRREVLRLKALMPGGSCRTIAQVFCRRFADKGGMTVGRTFVHESIRNNRHEILMLRRQIKNARPRPVPKNLTWGMDLTGKTDTRGRLHCILALVDHGTRAELGLIALANKASFTLLGHLLLAIGRYGKPRAIRTDNEAVVTSRRFRAALYLLGVRHQRIDPHCPWQNGRAERFFGTLKRSLDRLAVDSLEALNHALVEFRFFYNHVRPHQNLDGATPAEAWSGVNPHASRIQDEYWFEAWDGLLCGYYLRR